MYLQVLDLVFRFVLGIVTLYSVQVCLSAVQPDGKTILISKTFGQLFSETCCLGSVQIGRGLSVITVRICD